MCLFQPHPPPNSFNSVGVMSLSTALSITLHRLWGKQKHHALACVLQLRLQQQLDSQNAGAYVQAKLDLQCAFLYLFAFQQLISLPWPQSFMLDLAFQFSTHLALSRSQISVCLQWDFQPTRAQPLQRAAEGCVRMGVRVGVSLHTHSQRWKMTMSDRREGNNVFWCRWQCNYNRQTGQHITPYPSVWATHSWRGGKAPLFSSFSFTALQHTGPEAAVAQVLRELRKGGWGGICNRKTPYQYILMTGDKWASSLTGLFAVHKST